MKKYLTLNKQNASVVRWFIAIEDRSQNYPLACASARGDIHCGCECDISFRPQALR
jgi:hypothetical protein